MHKIFVILVLIGLTDPRVVVIIDIFVIKVKNFRTRKILLSVFLCLYVNLSNVHNLSSECE